MYTLRQYLTTMTDPDRLLRLEGTVEVCTDASGRPRCFAGNNAVGFLIRHNGRKKVLRCFLRPAARLREIYGDAFRPKALYLCDATRGEWVDVVLLDWIEGTSLRRRIEQAVQAGDHATLKNLARSFDLLAETLVTDDWAHGDLKPENILALEDGSLRLIDFDAVFRPEFKGLRSPELGTAAYQHPARTADDFDATLDDYPAALISTALHALELDPALGKNLNHEDGLLFDPRRIATDPRLRQTMDLFDRHGFAAQYRIAELLLSPLMHLPALPELLKYARHELDGYPPLDSTPSELDVRGNLWGFRGETGEWIIPPMYSAGFDFSEGLAAVRLNRTWSYISRDGATLLRCPQYTAVKPFRRGRATVERGNQRAEIDTTGKEFAI